ncbi:MAG: hypothetical protein WC657_06145 [Candidatus Paceibacterota bacterium]|jgi:hypothetical protein
MIVKQATPPKKFEPITIVLETETEAKLMWVSLNMSNCDVDFAAQRSGVNVRSIDGRFGMFNAFDDVFDPTE